VKREFASSSVEHASATDSSCYTCGSSRHSTNQCPTAPWPIVSSTAGARPVVLPVALPPAPPLQGIVLDKVVARNGGEADMRGAPTRAAVREIRKFQLARPLDSRSKGHKMLQSMGWKKGEGLGKEGGGNKDIVEPR